jgi:hypothetical protein
MGFFEWRGSQLDHLLVEKNVVRHSLHAYPSTQTNITCGLCQNEGANSLIKKMTKIAGGCN